MAQKNGHWEAHKESRKMRISSEFMENGKQTGIYWHLKLSKENCVPADKWEVAIVLGANLSSQFLSALSVLDLELVCRLQRSEFRGEAEAY